MKPFDLTAAKAGKPLVTRNGDEARFVAYVPECAAGYRVIAHIADEISTTAYTDAGKLWDDRMMGNDLFMATKKRTVYINVYESRLNTVANFGHHSAAFDTEDGARANAKANGVPVIAVAVPIEIEV